MLSLLLLVGAVAAQPFSPYSPYQPYGLHARQAPNVDEAAARYLINFGVFQMVSGELASVSPSTVEGTVRFFQNPFITDSDSKYTVEIKGLAADKKYSVTLSLTAAGAMATDGEIKTDTAPGFQLFDRFTVKGRNAKFNIDASNTRIKLTDYYVQIRDTSTTGTLLAETKAKLA